MEQAQDLHRNSIVIDGTCPLASFKGYWRNYAQGGATAVAATINLPPELMRDTMRRIGLWLKTLRANQETTLQVRSVEDILRAKKEKKLGIIFHFQGTTPFETDLNNLEIYHRLGVRMVQLTYNVKDFVGDGCAERTDCGLSEFGQKVIAELDRLGMVIDCAHTGYQTTMEAIEASGNPVIISHGNALAVCDNRRNLPDYVIRAVAKNGGVIGITGYPDFVSKRKPPTLDELIDHADYYAKLIGPDHISVGLDYFWAQTGVASEEEARATYDGLVAAGVWNPREYSPPPITYPEGIEMPERLGNLTAGLLKRGYGREDVQKIMGLNLLRIFEKVWGRGE